MHPMVLAPRELAPLATLPSRPLVATTLLGCLKRSKDSELSLPPLSQVLQLLSHASRLELRNPIPSANDDDDLIDYEEDEERL
jgi:hypothetical protein